MSGTIDRKPNDALEQQKSLAAGNDFRRRGSIAQTSRQHRSKLARLRHRMFAFQGKKLSARDASKCETHLAFPAGVAQLVEQRFRKP